MTRKRYRRLTRSAAVATLHALILPTAVVGLIDGWPVELVLAVVGLFYIWAAGQYQADLNFNPALDDDDRVRWRIVLVLVPYAITVYWLLHVRRRRALI